MDAWQLRVPPITGCPTITNTSQTGYQVIRPPLLWALSGTTYKVDV